MHAVNLIASAVGASAPELPECPTDAVCCVTGDYCKCITRNNLLGDSFTNFDLLKAPESKYIGVDVWISWMYGYKTSEDKKRLKCPERMSCWICDGKEFKELDRKTIRELVLEGCSYKQWAAYVTTSYKKHGSLFAPVNNSCRGVWQFEMLSVDCRDALLIKKYWDKMNEALNNGIGRSIIESLDMPVFLINKVGLKNWLSFEQWARPIYLSGLYQFIAYLLPSAEERKKVNGNKMQEELF